MKQKGERRRREKDGERSEGTGEHQEEGRWTEEECVGERVKKKNRKIPYEDNDVEHAHDMVEGIMVDPD